MHYAYVHCQFPPIVVGCDHVSAKATEKNEGYRKGHRSRKRSL